MRSDKASSPGNEDLPAVSVHFSTWGQPSPAMAEDMNNIGGTNPSRMNSSDSLRYIRLM